MKSDLFTDAQIIGVTPQGRTLGVNMTSKRGSDMRFS